VPTATTGVTGNAAISAIEHVASVAILIIKLVIGTSCMLRLRARNPAERVNFGLLQTFLEMYSENPDAVTAMLSYEQVNVRAGHQRT
jgi:hypothetical protein